MWEVLITSDSKLAFLINDIRPSTFTNRTTTTVLVVNDQFNSKLLDLISSARFYPCRFEYTQGVVLDRA
jgi:hypothetical protein